MHEWPSEPEYRYLTVEDMTPYFRSRHKQKRICPECHRAALEVKPTLNPNYGVDHCPKCHYFMTIEAPDVAKVPDDWARTRNEKCKIIKFSDSMK
jgi:hypothetical protein